MFYAVFKEEQTAIVKTLEKWMKICNGTYSTSRGLQPCPICFCFSNTSASTYKDFCRDCPVTHVSMMCSDEKSLWKKYKAKHEKILTTIDDVKLEAYHIYKMLYTLCEDIDLDETPNKVDIDFSLIPHWQEFKPDMPHKGREKGDKGFFYDIECPKCSATMTVKIDGIPITLHKDDLIKKTTQCHLCKHPFNLVENKHRAFSIF